MPTEYTEWQRSPSGVHAIIMEKIAQAGDCGGARPPPFTLSAITYKVLVYALAESGDTLPLFLLYPYMFSVVLSIQSNRDCMHLKALTDHFGGGSRVVVRHVTGMVRIT
jgi:hypothetical protein